MANNRLIGAHVMGEEGIFRFDPKKSSSASTYRIMMVDETDSNRVFYIDANGAILSDHIGDAQVT